MKTEGLTSWVIASTGQPLLQTVRRSARSYFYATKKNEAKEVQAFISARLRREAYTFLAKNTPRVRAKTEDVNEIPNIEEYDRFAEDFSQSGS
jgi:hypothetical protein